MLGRSWAGLLVFTEGLHQLGYLTQEEYEHFKTRYSEKWADPYEHMNEQNWSQSGEVHKPKENLAQMTVTFKNILKNWGMISPKNRVLWKQKAEKYRDRIPEVQLILAQPD